MNYLENLLINIMEECNEISENASKSARFGLDNHHPTDHPSMTNGVNLLNEFYQLQGLIEYLTTDLHVIDDFDSEIIDAIKNSKIKTMNILYNTITKTKNKMEDNKL